MDTNLRSFKPFVSWACFTLSIIIVLSLVLGAGIGAAAAWSSGYAEYYNWSDLKEKDFYDTEAFENALERTMTDMIVDTAEVNEDWMSAHYWSDLYFPYLEEEQDVGNEDVSGVYRQDGDGNWFDAEGRYISIEEMLAILAKSSPDKAATATYGGMATTAVATTVVMDKDELEVILKEASGEAEEEEPSEFAKKNVFRFNMMGNPPGTLYWSENLLNPDFVGTNMDDYEIENFEDASALAESLVNTYEFVFIIKDGALNAYRSGQTQYTRFREVERYDHLADVQLVLVGNRRDFYGSLISPIHSEWIAKAQNAWYDLRSAVIINLIGLALLVILAVIAFCLRRHRRAFAGQLYRILGHVWLEVKLAVFVVVGYLALAVLVNIPSRYGWYDTAEMAVMWVLCLGGFTVAGILLREFVHNYPESRKFGSWNLICRIGERISHSVRHIEQMYPFQRAMMLRGIALFTVVGVLFFLNWLLGLNGRYYYNGPIIILLFITAALVICCLWFWKGYKRMVNGMGQVMDAARDIRAGKVDAGLSFPAEHEFHQLGEDLSNIGEGLHHAVTESFKAERMKVELVTNISHDLKTPLTSIVSYSKLLRDLSLDPPADEYVDVICKKADRLDKLTKDLFEVSRAQSGNLPVNMEKIDLCAHVRQSLAELDERIAASGLDFRVKMSEKPVYIRADGAKLYRVIENLVVNAVKYAMSGTRVWVTVKEAEKVEFEIKNIAAYEMDFDAEHIAERFVRGDESRTDGGTGLGLAIARSFTEACAGEFRIDIDGDVFRVTMKFDRLQNAKSE